VYALRVSQLSPSGLLTRRVMMYGVPEISLRSQAA
jgi:hypothetical protein